MTDTKYSGGCFCGKVRYQAKAPVVWAGYCHCESCRSITGAAVVMHVGFSNSNITFSGSSLKIFESSPGLERGYCVDCGTPVSTGNAKFKGYIQVYVGTLDNPESVVPVAHVHADEKLSWFDINDELPHFAGSAAAGSDDWKRDAGE